MTMGCEHRRSPHRLRRLRAALAAAATAAGFVAAVLAPVAGAWADTGGARGAAIDTSSFPYRRRIPPGRAGISALRLDLAALAHSHLDDIRLVGPAGYQVPYLLEPDPDVLRAKLPPLRRVDGADVSKQVTQLGGHVRSVYALTLPLDRVPACRLVLETDARVFEREVSVLARHDDPRRHDAGRWRTVAWGSWRHANPGAPAAPLALDVPALEAAETRLVVDEGDNRPLPVREAALECRTWRLRFVRESGEELQVVYGRRDLSAPRYDLVLLESTLRSAQAADVAMEPEAEKGPPEKRTATIAFWVAFAAALVAIVAVVVRLVRPVRPADAGGPGA